MRCNIFIISMKYSLRNAASDRHGDMRPVVLFIGHAPSRLWNYCSFVHGRFQRLHKSSQDYNFRKEKIYWMMSQWHGYNGMAYEADVRLMNRTDVQFWPWWTHSPWSVSCGWKGIVHVCKHHTWNKIGILATGCRRYGAKNDTKWQKTT